MIGYEAHSYKKSEYTLNLKSHIYKQSVLCVGGCINHDAAQWSVEARGQGIEPSERG